MSDHEEVFLKVPEVWNLKNGFRKVYRGWDSLLLDGTVIFQPYVVKMHCVRTGYFENGMYGNFQKNDSTGGRWPHHYVTDFWKIIQFDAAWGSQ